MVIKTRRPPHQSLVHGGGSGVYRHASPLGAGWGGIRFRQLRKNHVRRTQTSRHPDHRGGGPAGHARLSALLSKVFGKQGQNDSTVHQSVRRVPGGLARTC